MSRRCSNVLYVRGERKETSLLFDFIKNISVSEYFINLEKSVEDIERYLSLPTASGIPLSDSFSVDIDKEEIHWESVNNPSILTVYKLSKEFPKIMFVFEFENIEDEVVGFIGIKNGTLIYQYFLDFSEGAINILLRRYRDEIMSLKEGDKVEVGLGMVEIECTSEMKTKIQIIKQFNVIFQSNPSPQITVYIQKDKDEDYINCVEYSDADGNEDAKLNAHHGEMCVHLEPFEYPWILEGFIREQKEES